MKKLSKLVALALACVMALTMLTACGANAKPAPGVKEKYPEVMAAINEGRTKNKLATLTEDEELDKIAASVIDDHIAAYEENNQSLFNGDKVFKQKVTIDGKTVAGQMYSRGLVYNGFTKYWETLKTPVTHVGIAMKESKGVTYFVIVGAKV